MLLKGGEIFALRLAALQERIITGLKKTKWSVSSAKNRSMLSRVAKKPERESPTAQLSADIRPKKQRLNALPARARLLCRLRISEGGFFALRNASKAHFKIVPIIVCAPHAQSLFIQKSLTWAEGLTPVSFALLNA